ETPTAKNNTNEKNLSVFTAQLFDDFLDVFPNQLFIRRIAQQVSRVKRRHKLDAVIAMPVTAQLGDRDIAFKQRLHGKFAQANDNFGLDQINLFFEERFTSRHFIRLGITILRRTAFNHIANINVLAFDADTFGNDVGQQLSSAADEWFTLQIFVAPRAFTDKHQLGIRIADPENQMGSARAKFAALAISDGGVQLVEALCLRARGIAYKQIVHPTSRGTFVLNNRRFNWSWFAFWRQPNTGALPPFEMTLERRR
ncbi:MAG TPA: hypothetical protein VNT76_02005, partial [Candidatus Binatus sp.]|nr:hypothetical protein [Candidatus Binatus sp.]